MITVRLEGNLFYSIFALQRPLPQFIQHLQYLSAKHWGAMNVLLIQSILIGQSRGPPMQHGSPFYTIFTIFILCFMIY